MKFPGHDEKGWPYESDTHGTNRGNMRQGKAAHDICGRWMAERGLGELAEAQNLLRGTRDRVKLTAVGAYELKGHDT